MCAWRGKDVSDRWGEEEEVCQEIVCFFGRGVVWFVLPSSDS